MYSASAMDNATQFCFLLFQETRADPMNWHVPLVLFLSVFDPAKSESEYPIDAKQYRGMIGFLLYLSTSRPDIMFSVCMCTRFQSNPRYSHLMAVKRIISIRNN